MKAALEAHAELQGGVFVEHSVGLLHGRMKAEDKLSVMDRFRAGDLDVLVSTTVVEVGVDVPNATVMMVEPWRQRLRYATVRNSSIF